MLEPEDSLITLKKSEPLEGPASRGRGRPKKTQDNIADERNADVAWLESKNLQIRRNLLTNDIEYLHPSRGLCIFQGDQMTTFTHLCAEVFGETIIEGRMRNAILFIADKAQYHPVRDYLNRCVAEAEPSTYLDSIATTFFNNDSEIANEGMKRFLVGLVGRALTPGCPLSFLPVLQGGQGLGKSRFARELVGGAFFAELSVSLDTLIKESYRMHVGWLLELPECDRFFTPKEAENLKNIVTISVDEVRRPYSLPQKAPRSFGLLGTTNQPEFLVDATGNRRFIPIKINVDPDVGVDIDKLIAERDSLWAAAVTAYHDGYPSEFTSGELAALAEYQQDFLEQDSWSDSILTWVNSKDEVTIPQVLTDAVGLSLDRHQTQHRRRAASILKTNGWRLLNTTRRGRKVRLWVNPDKTVKRQLNDF